MIRCDKFRTLVIVSFTCILGSCVQKTREHVAFLYAEDEDGVKLKQILSSGIDVNMADADGKTLVHHAVLGFLSSRNIRILYEKKASLDYQDANGRTPLYDACNNGNDVAAEELLKLGANPNIHDRCGRMPIHMASKNANLECVVLLKKFGADVNWRDDQGRFPIHYASGFKTDTMEDAIRHGGGKGDIDPLGWPIWDTAEVGKAEIVTLLIDWGAKADSRDYFGCMPSDYAQKEGYTKVVELLKGGR